MAPLSLLEWIRNLVLNLKGIFVMWKAILKAFEVVGNGLAWRVGSGHLLRIGLDPWAGCFREHLLNADLRSWLEQGGYFYLAQVGDPNSTNLWSQAWKIGRMLGLVGEDSILWERYIQALRRANISLTDWEDELLWDGDPGGAYTPKAGYVQLSVDFFQREVTWWWRKLWKQ